MRAFKKGNPFMDVESEHWVPGARETQEMRTDIAEARRERRKIPVFTEAYLYPRVGKDDARFILAVAEEYEHIIKILGEEEVRKILQETVPRQ